MMSCRGLLDQFDPNAEVVSGGGDPQEVESIEDAAGSVDFSIAAIGRLPDDVGSLNKIMVHEHSVVHLKLDKDLLESIFSAAQIEISLPDSLNESPIVVSKSAGISQEWGTDEGSTLSFAQFRSPAVDYPDDFNIDEFGVAVLQFLGRSEEEARKMGETIDWANTLLLPIPGDADVSATEVDINGAGGVLFDKGQNQARLMWHTNGMTYMLGGEYSAEQLLDMARSVQ